MKTDPTQPFSRFVGCLLLFLLGGCFLPHLSSQPKGFRLPLPTQDEIAWVDGEILTTSQLFSIQSELHSPSIPVAYWVGVACIVLQKSSQLKGNRLPYKTALEIARYAIRDLPLLQESESLKSYATEWNKPLTPEDIRKEIESGIRRATIKKNEGILAHL